MNATTSNLPILRQENVQMIIQSAPDAYNINTQSSARCNDAGRTLLAEIQRCGMSDDLDVRCAAFIDKTKRTIKAMNERRAPVTKLFDQIRAEFTGMENAIDPTKKDSIPYLIQQARNSFAAKKREEAERQRQEELRRQQREQALVRYRQDAEDDFLRQFEALLLDQFNALTSLNQALTIDTFDQLSEKIKTYNITLGNEWFQQCKCYAHKPFEISDEEAEEIRRSILNHLSKIFKERYNVEVGELRDSIVDMLPAKLHELQLIAQANAEEQERMTAELAAREAAEARRLESDRRRLVEEAKAAKQVQQTASEMDGLFSMAAVAAPADYQPKTAVKKRIVADNADGILAVVSMWWSKEGQFLPLDELSKIFKKQITFCERLASDKASPELISSPFVRYEEEVKAK